MQLHSCARCTHKDTQNRSIMILKLKKGKSLAIFLEMLAEK